MLDLSCSSWLMAAARMANLFLGKPTCSMNESPSPVSCFGFDLLEGGLHRHKPRLCVFKNGCLLSKVSDLFEFLKMHSRAINESLMRNRWFESFIPHFASFFYFPEWMLAPSIYAEIAELCTLLPWMHNNVFNPRGFPVFCSSIHKPLATRKCPEGWRVAKWW